MAENIPSENDLIVVGTGLTESIIAAAASRIGKKVLHLDHRDYYGSKWAAFTFGNLPNVLQQSPVLEKQNIEADHAEKNEDLFLNDNSFCYENIHEKWFCSEETVVNPEDQADSTSEQLSSTKQWTKAELLKETRKFNFDLAPKVLYSRGDMVEVLISSGICRYAEFKNVSSVYTYDLREKRLLPVPCSRADVFSSKDITMVEKRLLMKALSMCSEYDKKPEDFQDIQSKSFGEFLSSQKIQGKIRQYIMDSVAMAKEETDFSTATRNIQKFMRSTGRYGNTPFLWTLYGSGELPQCFCRCSAVFGGVYCLKRRTERIVMDSNHLAIGVMSEKEILKAPFIVIEDAMNPRATVISGISRAILVTDKSITGDHVALINFPSSLPGKDPVKILELSASAMACPRNLFVVHLTTTQGTTAQEDLKEVMEVLFNSGQDRPNILWSIYFNVPVFDSQTNLPSNVYCCPGPSLALDCDSYVVKAKEIFHSMFPDEEFLPRVPDPEDVILEEPVDDQAVDQDA